MKKLTMALAAATMLTGFAVTASLADVVKIGVMAPLTGPTASDGEEFVKGVELAVQGVPTLDY